GARLADAEQHAAPGGLATAGGPADLERLAGHDRVLGAPLVHRVGVDDPGHDLLVGVDVGGRHVALGAEQVGEIGRVAAGQALQLAARHLRGVADDAALAAAEGDVDDLALPGHPGRQRLDLLERHVRVVADAALG